MTALRTEIACLTELVTALQADIQFIKGIFLAKQAKKERRWQKKEEQRLAAEREAKARKIRQTYEHIIWKLIRWSWELMPAPPSKLSPKELELAALLARNKTHEQIAHQMNLKENSILIDFATMSITNKSLARRSTRTQKTIAWMLSIPRSRCTGSTSQ